ncbi:MAG TPA: ammonium transporter [Clostridiaceae bacterium]
MGNINGADTAFLIFCTALVLLMTPGLALFYGGMVRRKNVLSTTMHSYSAMAVISIQWILIGYSFAFGGNHFGIIGDFSFLGLKGVGFAPSAYAPTIPAQLFMMYQMMFAIITPALISGAFAERIKFPAFLLFILLWSTLVYDPIAHWVWGAGGWINKMGALDFAGGSVVHISSGVSALVLAIILGKRKKGDSMAPHHIPMTVLGAGLLWFGWFGFNSGSALGINSVAINAFLTTNTSAAAAALSWMLLEYLYSKKTSVLGLASGAVAGLVSITPAAGYVSPMAAIIIGFVGGAICYLSVTQLKKRFGYDDALDAFGCHGIGGTWGGIATGIFAWKGINGNGANGLLHGGTHLIIAQIISIIAVYVYAALMTFLLVKGIGLFMKFRVSEEDERTGLDIAQQGEEAYGQFY